MKLDALSVGDIGAIINATISDDNGAVDLTGATVTLLLTYGSAKVAKTASVVSAAAGTVTYTTVSGDLPSRGQWKLQWRVVNGTTTLFYPPIPDVLPVYDNIA